MLKCFSRPGHLKRCSHYHKYHPHICHITCQRIGMSTRQRQPVPFWAFLKADIQWWRIVLQASDPGCSMWPLPSGHGFLRFGLHSCPMNILCEALLTWPNKNQISHQSLKWDEELRTRPSRSPLKWDSVSASASLISVPVGCKWKVGTSMVLRVVTVL